MGNWEPATYRISESNQFYGMIGSRNMLFGGFLIEGEVQPVEDCPIIRDSITIGTVREARELSTGSIIAYGETDFKAIQGEFVIPHYRAKVITCNSCKTNNQRRYALCPCLINTGACVFKHVELVSLELLRGLPSRMWLESRNETIENLEINTRGIIIPQH